MENETDPNQTLSPTGPPNYESPVPETRYRDFIPGSIPGNDPIGKFLDDSPDSKASSRGVTKFRKISDHILIPTKAHVAHIEETKRMKNVITQEMDPWWEQRGGKHVHSKDRVKAKFKNTPSKLFSPTASSIRHQHKSVLTDPAKLLSPTATYRHAFDEEVRSSSPSIAQWNEKELFTLKKRLLAASYTTGGADIKTLFRHMDTDHSGTLDLSEVGHLVRKIIPVTDRQLRYLLKAIDVDGSGSVDENELIAFIADTQQPSISLSQTPKRSPKMSVGSAVESVALSVDRHTVSEVRSTSPVRSLSPGITQIAHWNEKELFTLKNRLLAASYTTGGADIKTLFRHMDTDHSGTLDLSEVGHLVKRLIPDVTDRQLRYLLKAIDVDSSGSVDEDELIAFITDRSISFKQITSSMSNTPEKSETPDTLDSIDPHIEQGSSTFGLSLRSVFEAVNDMSVEEPSINSPKVSNLTGAVRRNSTLLDPTSSYISHKAVPKQKETLAQVDHPIMIQSSYAKVSMAQSQSMYEFLLEHLNSEFKKEKDNIGVDTSFLPFDLPKKIRSPADSWIPGTAQIISKRT